MNIAGNAKIRPEDLDAGVQTAWEFVRQHDDTLQELKGYGQAIARLSDLTSDDELRGAFWALGDAIQSHAEKLETGKIAAFKALHPVVLPGAREELQALQGTNPEAQAPSKHNEKDIS
jgi:hypothetical protein